MREARLQFSLKSLFVLTMFVCFAASLRYEYRTAYYEARGWVVIEQPALGFGVVYSWPDDGFDRSYTPQLELFAAGRHVRIPKSYYIEPKDRSPAGSGELRRRVMEVFPW